MQKSEFFLYFFFSFLSVVKHGFRGYRNITGITVVFFYYFSLIFPHINGPIVSYLKIISLMFSESLQWIKLKIAATLVNDKLKNSSS